MEQGLVKKETLTAIGNSIRAKNGTETTYTPAEMPGAIEAIKSGAENQQLDVVANGTYNAPEGVGYSPVVVNVPQDGAPTAEELTLTGDCSYRFYNGGWSWFIKKYGNQITTKDITNCTYMFKNCNIETIPFEINCNKSYSINFDSAFFLFSVSAEQIPKINNAKPSNMSNMFSSCFFITEYPADMDKWFDWSEIDGATGSWSGEMSQMFQNNWRLRKLPYNIFKHGNPQVYNGSCIYNTFLALYCLDEIIDLPNPYYKATYTNNIFGFSPFYHMSHLKDLTFASTMTNGEPNNPQWSNQKIDLTQCVGYDNIYPLSQYGLPKEKEIVNDATYQQFKNDPDAWTRKIEYSRYNHDSAVRTINSLPDTSAFIASNGGKNTIKFAGANGSKTDGGAISNLTPEEIAVATARGWTVEIV